MHSFLKVESPQGNTLQKVLEPIQRVWFTKSSLRHASIREKKGPSLGKNKCQSSSSAKSPRCEIWGQVPMNRLNDSSDVPAKNMYKLKEKDKAAFYFPAEEWVLPAALTKEPEEREFVVDSGAGMHVVSKKDLNSVELETMRTSRSPTTVMTANREVQTREEATVYVKELDLFVKDMLLEGHSRSSFLVETPVRIHGIRTTGSAVKNHISSEMAKELIAMYRTVYHLWFLESQRVLPQLHLHLLLHHGNPVPERSGSTSEELRWDPLHESTETENKNKNGESKEVQRDISHELPGWLQEFRENLVDENGPSESLGNQEQRSQNTSKSSHELPMEPRAKVEPRLGEHSVYTHFPRDPHCDICLKTKITRTSCRRRAGTVLPERNTLVADHKVLNEESESRNNHRYVVVLQDLATQWLQSYPCKTKTSEETQKT